MKKKVLSLMLVGAMAASLFAGCGGKDNGSAGGGTQGGGEPGGVEAVDVGADNLEESREITVWLYKDDYKIYDSYDENPVVQYLNNKFNCTLKFQQPAMGSEKEQFSLMLGTGSYTDVMEVSNCQEGVASLYEDGVIKDLAPYLENYMPNFYAFLNAPENADVKKSLYDKDGHLFTIPFQVRTQDENRWGGMVYRRDILETMTGGNVAFPSGSEEPETVEDWEYILEMMKMYFDAAGLADSACLIIPAQGYFQTGELLTGFGVGGDFYVQDGTVKYGPTEQGFYNYLVKMKEWYEKGYIYQDFASRTNDVFYLPNTALTYGGSAGIWFGMNAQLDGAMSMPEYGLEVNVQPIASPLDAANTSARLAQTGLENERVAMNTQGYVIADTCSEENMIRFMSVSDYLFTDEGAMLRSYGLTAEQGAAENSYYAAAGLAGGAYTMEGETFTYAEPLVPSVGALSLDGSNQSYIGSRLPGLLNNEYDLMYATESANKASAVWKGTGRDNNYPSSIAFAADDNDKITSNYSNYSDYLNTMVPKFIMGTEELTEESFAAFVEQMKSLGVEENLGLYQSYYDAFMSE